MDRRRRRIYWLTRLVSWPGTDWAARHRRLVYWLTCLASWPFLMAALIAILRLTHRWRPEHDGVERFFVPGLWGLMLGQLPATWVCRRLGISLETRETDLLARRNTAPAPDTARFEARIDPATLAVAGTLAGALTSGLFILARGVGHPLPLVILAAAGAVGTVILWVKAVTDGNLAVAVDERGVTRGTLAGTKLIPWEEISGWAVETHRDVLGRTTSRCCRFRDRTGRVVFTVRQDVAIHAGQFEALLVTLRAHHGLPARTELEASPAPEGTGTELVAEPIMGAPPPEGRALPAREEGQR